MEFLASAHTLLSPLYTQGSKVVDQPTEASLEKSACRQSSRRMPRCRYSPNCRQGVFSETPIHPLGCLCVRTGAMGRFLARGQILSSHLAIRLDGYSPNRGLDRYADCQRIKRVTKVGCRHRCAGTKGQRNVDHHGCGLCEVSVQPLVM